MVFLCFGLACVLAVRPAAESVETAADPSPTPRRSTRPASVPKYSKFPHGVHTGKLKLACGSCHKFPSANWKTVRPEKDGFPDETDYPQHQSCINCHRQQFFKGARPAICSICHANPSPRDSSRHPFPNPREIFDQSPKGKKAESDFVVAFPHDKHIEIVTASVSSPIGFVNAAFVGGDRRRAAEESCSVCHKTMTPQDKSDDEFFTKPPPKWGDAFWLKKGTFKSTPIGHATCFTCHSADTGILPAPQTCAACHQPKPPQPVADFDAKLAMTMSINDKATLLAWRHRYSSGTFRHEWFSHAELSCATCHNVMTIKTENPLTEKVSISSCTTCHATATSDDGGALNYEADMRKKDAAFQCVKCHVTFGKLPIPESHIKLLAAGATVK